MNKEKSEEYNKYTGVKQRGSIGTHSKNEQEKQPERKKKRHSLDLTNRNKC